MTLEQCAALKKGDRIRVAGASNPSIQAVLKYEEGIGVIVVTHSGYVMVTQPAHIMEVVAVPGRRYYRVLPFKAGHMSQQHAIGLENGALITTTDSFGRGAVSGVQCPYDPNIWLETYP